MTIGVKHKAGNKNGHFYFSPAQFLLFPECVENKLFPVEYFAFNGEHGENG